MRVIEETVDIPELHEEKELFLLLTYDEAGDPYYVYLRVPHSRCRELAQKCRDGEPIEVSKIGWIVTAGVGHQPDPEVMQDIEERFGTAHLPELYFTPETIDQANQERWEELQQEEAAQTAESRDDND